MSKYFRIWTPILISIIVPFLPYLSQYLSPEHKFEYNVKGPVTVKQLTSLEVRILNNGSKTEKNVYIQIAPEFPRLTFKRSVSKDTNITAMDISNISLPTLVVDSNDVKNIVHEGNFYYIYFGDIRPNDEVSCAILLSGTLINTFSNKPSISRSFTVKSDDQVAVIRVPKDYSKLAYVVGFWLLSMFSIMSVVKVFYTRKYHQE
ncbi:hypothetical protein [Geotalea sp. SG265]|uniref:hypothetical protein n=1 Tax=Geotalea sp. SG265 TaxID=2922867 RepID=UPI001FAF6850|nr:hypothetical protein [Geotalea sp. SG265]